MKKFTSTDLGGAPIFKGDLFGIFNKDIWTAVEALLSPFNSDTQGIVVSGCVTTNNAGNFDMTAGVVYLNGEFMEIPSYTNQAFTKYIAPSSVVDDTRTFQDGSSHVVASKTSAGIYGSAPGSGQYLTIASLTDLDDRRWSTLFVRGTNKTPIPWTNITLINSWASVSGQTAQYMMDSFGQVHLRGVLDGTGLTNAVFANIPTGITHATDRDVATFRFNGSAFEVIGFEANSSGTWKSFSNTLNNNYYLDGISYWP